MQLVEVIVNVPVVLSHTTAGIETIQIGKFLVTKSEFRKVHYILVKYHEKG